MFSTMLQCRSRMCSRKAGLCGVHLSSVKMSEQVQCGKPCAGWVCFQDLWYGDHWRCCSRGMATRLHQVCQRSFKLCLLVVQMDTCDPHQLVSDEDMLQITCPS
ncbi:hypothetical protein V6N11_073311 [Hibiscus sabdariffa]